MTAKEKIEKLLTQILEPCGFEILADGIQVDTIDIDQTEVDPKGLIVTAEDQKFLIQVSML